MTERLTDGQVDVLMRRRSGVDANLAVLAAREVSEWRRRFGSLDQALTVDELRRIFLAQAELLALRALIPKVIETLDMVQRNDTHWSFNPLIAKLRSALQ